METGCARLPVLTSIFGGRCAIKFAIAIVQTKSVIRVEPNVFRTTGTRQITLIFRYASPKAVTQTLSDTSASLWYFIDDDVWAFGSGDGLPSDYVKRQIQFRRLTADALIAKSVRLLSSSKRILDRFPDTDGAIVPPALVHRLPSLDHHDREPGDPFDIVFSGTRSHLDDFKTIELPLRACLQENPHWRLTTFLGRHAPRGLRLPNARHLKPMEWQAYRRFVSRNRFHLALCPLQATDFNAARSASRLLDSAAFGAAPAYSPVPPYGRLFATLGTPFHPETLQECLHACAESPETTRVKAEKTAQKAADIGSRQKQRSFWFEQFSFG